MSDKDLQWVTESVSDIGQPSDRQFQIPSSRSSSHQRRNLQSRRNHVAQKVRIPGRTLYISVHDDPTPAEVFLRIKGRGCTAEIIALYDAIARFASLALQCGASLEKVRDLLVGTKFQPAGPVQDHRAIKNCTNLPDLIGRHLLVECCGKKDLAHFQIEEQTR